MLTNRVSFVVYIHVVKQQSRPWRHAEYVKVKEIHLQLRIDLNKARVYRELRFALKENSPGESSSASEVLISHITAMEVDERRYAAMHITVTI